MEKKNPQKTPEEIKAEEKYPGAAIDAADKDKVTPEEVKERTDVLDGPTNPGQE